MMPEIIPLPAFDDNYLWLIRRGDRAAVVDPGDAAPVMAYVASHDLSLDAILLTHHHGDHIGGVSALVERFQPAVIGPNDDRIGGRTRTVAEGDVVALEGLGLELQVIEVPGHTRSHVAYYGGNALFCGDTLFVAGCGRLFEGTPAQMAASLGKLAALPGSTRVYCAHEYTLSNIRFARAVEPDNAALADLERRAQATRARNEPTVPSTIDAERATNPFLRCDQPGVMRAAGARAGTAMTDPVAVLATIREWKNKF